MDLKNYLIINSEIQSELNEASILDLDDLLHDSDKKVIDKAADMLFNEYPINEPGKDAYGRPIAPGDWVVCVPTGQKSLAAMTFGIIKRLSAKRVTVSIKSDKGHVGWLSAMKNPKRYAEATMDISVDPKFIFKITDKENFINSLK